MGAHWSIVKILLPLLTRALARIVAAPEPAWNSGRPETSVVLLMV